MRTLQSQIVWSVRVQRLLGGLMLVAAVSFYVWGYRPSTRKLAALRAEVASRTAELHDNRAKSKIKTEIASKNERLRQELDRIRKPSTQQELPQLIKDLTFCAQAANLKRFNTKRGMPERTDLLLELPIGVTFEGDFVSAFNFLRSTEDMQRLTRLRSITLKAKDDSTGEVEADVTLDTYFTIE